MVTRHEFLDMLHYHLQPRGYLEIGVLYGDSLRLARCPRIGIDPDPQVLGHFPETSLYRGTSDSFFQNVPREEVTIDVDLAFIDGMHLAEFALRDLFNIETNLASPRTVVVFDDVLPRNQEEAHRIQCPGDWTGDVWKVWGYLDEYRPDLQKRLVDTSPTGTMVIWGLRQWDAAAPMVHKDAIEAMQDEAPVPDWILTRNSAQIFEVDEVLLELEAWCALP